MKSMSHIIYPTSDCRSVIWASSLLVWAELGAVVAAALTPPDLGGPVLAEAGLLGVLRTTVFAAAGLALGLRPPEPPAVLRAGTKR